VNAHKVNAGRPPALTGYPDFFWFNSDETEATAAMVADIVARRIPARFGLDPAATCRSCVRCTAARPAPGT
jgi:exodeoxyribonuclease V alpha subunit